MSHGAVAPTKSLPRGMLWTGILLMILGFVVGIAAIVGGVVKVANAASDSAKFTAPGSVDVVLAPGEHAIWVATAGLTPDASATVTGPSGEAVPFTSYNGSTTLSLNGQNYAPEVVFPTTTAGKYTIKIELADPSSALQFPAFVGPTPASIGKSVLLVFGLIGVAFFLFAIGVVLLIVALVRRSRARKRAALVAGGYPGQPMAVMPPSAPLPTMPPPAEALSALPPPAMTPPPLPPPLPPSQQ
jgi:hypothetical protein